MDRLSHHDARSDDVDLPAFLDRLDRALAVDRVSQRIHDPADVPRAGRNIEHAAGPPDLITLV